MHIKPRKAVSASCSTFQDWCLLKQKKLGNAYLHEESAAGHGCLETFLDLNTPKTQHRGLEDIVGNLLDQN